MEEHCTACVNHGLIGMKAIRLKEMPIEIIINTACLYLKISKSDILGRKRYRHISEKRQMIMHYLSRERKFMLTHIGANLFKDHTTVIHAVKHIDNLCQSDVDFKFQYNELTEYLNNL